MSLKEVIYQDLITAMKARDEVTLRTLRMLKSAIMKHEVSARDAVADDSIVLGLIQKEAKSRNESVEQFRKGGREDLAISEEEEIKVLQKYLPEQLSESELKNIVTSTIHEVGASSVGDIGKVMAALMPKVKGKADGNLVNKLVREFLS